MPCHSCEGQFSLAPVIPQGKVSDLRNNPDIVNVEYASKVHRLVRDYGDVTLTSKNCSFRHC